MNVNKLFEICKQHGLYCKKVGNSVKLTNKAGEVYETIKPLEGNEIHSDCVHGGDIDLYAWLGYGC